MKPVPTSIRLANYRLVPQQHGADVPQDDSRGFSGHGERLSRGMPTANELPGRQPEIARREAIAPAVATVLEGISPSGIRQRETTGKCKTQTGQ